MPQDRFVFLDFDNTLSDQFQLLTQYVREVGAYLAPQYGGDPGDWARQTADALEALQADYLIRFATDPLNGYCDWLEAARIKSTELVFGGMGLPAPPDPGGVARDAQFQALLACDAAYPGARDALQALFEGGARVQMASANDSEFLLAALMGAGLEDLIESKFGPDLVDCAKEGAEFYRRLFTETGVAPREALVVDDTPDSLRQAMEAGARVIQANLSPERRYDTVPGVAAVLTDLRDLPALVNQLMG